MMRLLTGTRLLSLTGPGGVGKTRLALQLAGRVADQFPDDVAFVSLAPLTDPELVASTIIDTLKLEPGQLPARERLLRYLGDRRALLVLDNFEQVLGAGTLVAEILRECPEVKVIVSSRAPLRISGEQELPVPPLELPDSSMSVDSIARTEAARLFIDRVVAMTPSFVLTESNAAAIAAICTRLEGLPLAIELAAAWVRVLPPAALLDRLHSRLGLRSTARDIPDRQRTLRATIDWSYDLLDEPARRLFARLALFRGGATLEDIEAICSEGPGQGVLDSLGVLIDHSLVRREGKAESPRLVMLETVREFALEQLEKDSASDGLRQRHARRYLALGEEAAPHLIRAERRVWLSRLDRELENLRSAFDYCASNGRIEEALRFVSALWRFWQIRGYLHEGRQRAERVLADSSSKAHPRQRERALDGAGGLAYWVGDMPTMLAHYEESLELARMDGEPSRISNALYNLTFRWLVVETSVPVEERLRQLDLSTDEALTLARQAGDHAGIARCLWAQANITLHLRQDKVSALNLLGEAIDIFRNVGDLFGLAWASHTQGIARLHAQDPEGAGAAFREAVSLLSEVRDPGGVAIILMDEAQLALAGGNRVRAVRLAGASAALRHLTGADMVSLADAVEGRAIHATDADMGPWKEGLAMTFDEAVACALERAP
jgi:predicted ATPase